MLQMDITSSDGLSAISHHVAIQHGGTVNKEEFVAYFVQEPFFSRWLEILSRRTTLRQWQRDRGADIIQEALRQEELVESMTATHKTTGNSLSEGRAVECDV